MATIDIVHRQPPYCEIRMGAQRQPSELIPLSTATYYILLALADGDQHGYGVMREVAASSGGQVQLGAGTLYAAINRLRGARLIEESDERPDPRLDDQRRRYYRLTNLGRAVAQAESERLARLVNIARTKNLLAQPASNGSPEASS